MTTFLCHLETLMLCCFCWHTLNSFLAMYDGYGQEQQVHTCQWSFSQASPWSTQSTAAISFNHWEWHNLLHQQTLKNCIEDLSVKLWAAFRHRRGSFVSRQHQTCSNFYVQSLQHRSRFPGYGLIPVVCKSEGSRKASSYQWCFQVPCHEGPLSVNGMEAD